MDDLFNTPENEQNNEPADTQAFVNDAEPISQDFENIEPEEFYAPEPLNLTEVKRIPLNTSNKGLKIFAAVLAAVILLTFCTAGGYIWGQQSLLKNNVKNPNVSLNLNKKPDSNQLSAAEVYEKANPFVVGIQAYNDESASTASGVIFSKDGYIITNDHIYEKISSPNFYVFTSDKKEYKATFVAGDARSDLAILKIDGVNDLTPAVFGNSSELYIGEDIAAIGRPISADTDSNLTTGTISLLNRRLSITSSYSLKYIQTDAPINPGSSGGALVNMYGQVVGITSAKIAGTEYEGLGLAIPSTTVKTVAESLIKHGYVKGRAKMGVSYVEIGAVNADVQKFPRGLYISEVSKDADAYGKLNEGDIITKVNGIEITADDVLLDIIDDSSPGDTLSVSGENQKSGKPFSVEITLGEDKGSSSYSVTKQENDADNEDDSSDSGAFDFPFGE